ncbi:MAG: hypothetical protein ACK5NE_06035 [Brachymonas sp.]
MSDAFSSHRWMPLAAYYNTSGNVYPAPYSSPDQIAGIFSI